MSWFLLFLDVAVSSWCPIYQTGGPKDGLILSFEQLGEPEAYLSSGFYFFCKPASCQSCFSLFDNISSMIYLVSGVPQRRFLQFPANLPAKTTYHLGKYMLLLILLGHILTAKPNTQVSWAKNRYFAIFLTSNQEGSVIIQAASPQTRWLLLVSWLGNSSGPTTTYPQLTFV